MPSLLTPRRSSERSRGPVSLQASETVSDPAEAPEVDPISWPVAAVVGGLCTAATTWVVVTGIVVCGWLMAASEDLSQALELGTRIWLLAGGIATRVGSLPLTLVPWGVTALLVAMLYRFGGYAVRRIRPGQTAGPGAVAVVIVLSHLLVVAPAAVFFGEPARAPGHALAVTSVLAAAAYLGAVRGSGHDPRRAWPGWLRGFPVAVGAAALMWLLAGSAVLVVGLVLGWARVETLTRSLEPGVAGGALLLVAQLAVLPNAIVWSGSYALGAGFNLGSGSVVAPAATQLGVLPGLPLLGALPATGPGGTQQLWWLAAGALSGAVAAWLVLRGGVGSRFDQTSLLGGLSGVLAGVTFVGIAWITSGDLGVVRLTGLGPRLVPLLVMATATLGLSGLLTGAVIGLLRGGRAAKAREEPGAGEQGAEPTTHETTKQAVAAERTAAAR